MCAALSAREAGAPVLVVEKAPEAWRGGNGFFTAGGFRFAFKSFEELCELVGDLSDDEKASMEVDPYTEEMFYDDLMRVTEECADPDLAMLLVRLSQPTVRWMRDRGVRWIPMFGRQAYKVGGRFRFWGGLVLEAVGGGPGLIDMEYQAAARAGIDVRLETKATRLVTDERGAVTGVVVRTPAGTETIPARAVVLAAGGFEANPEMRTRYLGRNWDLARVRGTPYNTGDAIRMALEVGALPWGHWSGCHAVAWDLNAPWHGDRKVGDNFQKHSYPLGIIVNARGDRFVDEGADFRNYTYVKYGRAIISSRGAPRSRSSTRRSCTSCGRSTGSARSRRPRPRRSRAWRASSTSTSRGWSARSRRSTPPCSPARSIRPSRTARARAGSRRPSRTGRCRSTRRLTSATPSRPGSPSRSAGFASPSPRKSWTPSSGRFPGSSRPASSWAGSSTTTTRAAPGSWRAPCSAGSPGGRPPPTVGAYSAQFSEYLARSAGSAASRNHSGRSTR